MDEQDIPIDIQTGKLVDWLITRRHVNRNWPEAVRIIREKINNAIQDMPEHPEITKLLSGTYINYFHCCQIVDILKETEKDSKNILGWYTSQRMKDWQEVVNLYGKNNVYLAEAAQMLVRNTIYEVPSIKRQIAKCQQIQEDCERKEIEYTKSAAAAQARYYETCNTLGISGEKVKSELVSLLKDLPSEFDKIAAKAKQLAEARQFYSDFVSFTCPSQHSDCLPILKYVIEHGNITVYEWTYGEAPISIEMPELHFDLSEDEDKTDDVIDYGGNEIDFGGPEEVASEDVNLETGDIDWGNLTTDAQIDWGIGEVEEDTAVDIVLEDSGVAGGVAQDFEAFTLLYYEKTRNQFINDLLELEGFFTQRITELKSEETVLSFNQFTGAPHSVQYHNEASVIPMLALVKEIWTKLSTTKMQQLYMISISPKYVDRLTSSLQAKLAVKGKMEASKTVVIQQRQDAAKQGISLQPQLELIIDRTKELQKHIEEHISIKYKNREVNLMGGINVL